MRIAKLYAHQIKGFQDFSTDCGDVNICAGSNGTNKTSTLTLVTALFGNLGRGNKGNPRILRAGAESGEIGAVIMADDGSESWDVSREVKPGKIDTPKITSSLSGKVGSPVDWLQPLIDRVSIEPISRAMNATEQEQTAILLDTIPVAVDPNELAAAVDGIDVPGLAAHLKNAPKMPSGLDAIAAVHKVIYEARTNVNRDAKIKKTHASELLSGIPESAGDGTDWKLKAEEVERELRQQAAAESADRAQCEKDLAMVREQSGAAQNDQLRQIDSAIDARIRELEQERAAQKLCVQQASAEYANKLNSAHQANLDSVTAKYRPEIERLGAEYALAKQNWMDQAGHNRTRAIAAQNERESGTLQEKSEAMTSAIDRLDKLQSSLLGELDREIKGLSVQDGVIMVDGMPLSEQNTAERVKFWLRIGAMRAGELGVCCADGLECLDDKQFKTVVDAMAGSGIQWFLGRVDNLPFRVEKVFAEDMVAA